MSDGWDTRPVERRTSAAAPSGGGGHGLGEIVLGLWRAKWLMLLVFLPIFALGLFVATQLPTEYAARSTLVVSISDEYVYRPRVGSESMIPATPDPDTVVQAELEILRSQVVAERTLTRFGLRRVYPDLADEYESAPPPEREEIFQKGVEALIKDFTAGSAPKSSVIGTSFKHPDPQLAADVLNAIIGNYLTFRSEIFSSGGSTAFTEQRKRFEGELLDAEAAIEGFLRENRIGDFEAERASAAGLYANLTEELYRVRTRASAVQGEMAVTRAQLDSTPAEVNLFVEDNSTQTLQQLELEREQLLTRYRPDSTPVREIEKRIAQVRNYVQSQTGDAGVVRRGPNPLYEQIQQRLSGLQAEAQSLAQQEAALQSQINGVAARQSRLNSLAPRYQELVRQKDLMEANVRSFAEREIEEVALKELTQAETDNIRIIERARPPAEGSSLKLPAAALSFLFAGFTALVIGLLSAFSRERVMTPESLSRETGLPVLATVRRRR